VVLKCRDGEKTDSQYIAQKHLSLGKGSTPKEATLFRRRGGGKGGQEKTTITRLTCEKKGAG